MERRFSSSSTSGLTPASNFAFDPLCDAYDAEFCYRLSPWLSGDNSFLIQQGYRRHFDFCFGDPAMQAFAGIAPERLWLRAIRHMQAKQDARVAVLLAGMTGDNLDLDDDAEFSRQLRHRVTSFNLYCKPLGLLAGRRSPAGASHGSQSAVAGKTTALPASLGAVKDILSPAMKELLAKVSPAAKASTPLTGTLTKAFAATPLAAFSGSQSESLRLCCTWAGGEAIPGLPYTARLADGSLRTGTLDSSGTSTLEGLPSGSVEVELGKRVDDAELLALRQQIKAGLDEILAAEKKEATELDAAYQAGSSVAKATDHMTAVGKGFWNSLVGFVTWANDVSKVASPAGYLSRTLQATWNASRSESDSAWLKRFQDAYSEQHKKDLVAALGFDPSKVSREDIAKAYEVANLILDDGETRQLFYDFAQQAAAAQHALEWSEIGGGVVFEVVFTALIAVLTGGVGAAASVGTKIRHADKLKRLAQPLKELAEKLKLKRLNQRKNGRTGSEVKAEVKKPDGTALHYRINGDYEPHPRALENGPKTGDTIYKRTHQHGNAKDPYTIMPDGKPLGASTGKMPASMAGLDELPADYENYVSDGWPSLNYEYKPGQFANDYANFADLRPVVIPKGTKIYRIVDEVSQDSGAYWAYKLPENKAAWRRDYAVKDSWNDNGYYVEHVVEDPDGLKVWVGRTAGQEYREFDSKEFYLEGGKEQIFITPGAVNPSPPKPTYWPDV